MAQLNPTPLSDFWKKIKSLFQDSEESSPSQPVVHEIIERSEAEKVAYEKWKTTLSAKRMLDWLNNQYAAFLSPTARTDDAIAFLNTPSAKGFVVHFHQTQYRKEEILHLFDLLREKVLEMNYNSYVSDVRTFNRPQWVESIQRHYMKPSLNFYKKETEKFDQGYGNIKIELEFRNDKVYNLRFSATTYQDQNFNKADEFKELMGMVLR